MMFRYLTQNLSKSMSIREWIIILPVTIYVFGFVIVNIYLGGLGVFNLELFRAKYISAGILFLFFFLLPIVYFSLLLFEELHKIGNEQLGKLTWAFIRISFGTFVIFGLIYLGLTRAFGFRDLPLGIPFLSPPKPFAEILGLYGKPILYILGAITLYTFGHYLSEIIFSIPKYLRDKQSRTVLSHIDFVIRNTKFPRFIVYVFSVSFYVLMLGILVALASGKGEVKSTQNYSWERFYLVSIIAYSFIALQAFLPFWGDVKTAEQKQKELENPKKELFPSTLTSIAYLFFFFCLLLFVYSIGVYPFIPQQAGGGQPIHVEILTSTQIETQPLGFTYLLERSTTGILTIDVDSTTLEYSIYETPLNNIKEIRYLK